VSTLLCASLCALVPALASAQLSGSVALLSDYRYRGISLSNDRPAAQAGIAYDHETGLYGGGFATNAYVGRDTLQTIAYAGFSRRLRPDLSWDCGASYYAYSGNSEYNYGEVYCGVATDRLSAKLYYSPDYVGLGARSWYAELNATLPFRDRLNLFGHAGLLDVAETAGDAYGVGYRSRSRRFDLRAGGDLDLVIARVQLAWVGSVRESGMPVNYGRRRNTIVLSVARQF
jgi:uncharacterized protein (TIGR02001 family)